MTTAHPAEVFLCLKGPDCTSELTGLYDVIARLMSIALENLGELLAGAKFEPCGAVVGPDRLKHCSSLPDLIGRHLLVEYCGRDDLAYRPSSPPCLGTGLTRPWAGEATLARLRSWDS